MGKRPFLMQPDHALLGEFQARDEGVAPDERRSAPASAIRNRGTFPAWVSRSSPTGSVLAFP